MFGGSPIDRRESIAQTRAGLGVPARSDGARSEAPGCPSHKQGLERVQLAIERWLRHRTRCRRGEQQRQGRDETPLSRTDRNAARLHNDHFEVNAPRVIDRDDEVAVLLDPDDHQVGPNVMQCVFALAEADDRRPVVLDLSALHIVDAALLRAIRDSVKRLRARGRALVVDSPPRQAMRALSLTRLDRLLTVRGPIRIQ
jgi:anti-anti-sigma factor